MKYYPPEDNTSIWAWLQVINQEESQRRNEIREERGREGEVRDGETEVEGEEWKDKDGAERENADWENVRVHVTVKWDFKGLQKNVFFINM